MPELQMLKSLESTVSPTSINYIISASIRCPSLQRLALLPPDDVAADTVALMFGCIPSLRDLWIARRQTFKMSDYVWPSYCTGKTLAIGDIEDPVVIRNVLRYPPGKVL